MRLLPLVHVVAKLTLIMLGMVICFSVIGQEPTRIELVHADRMQFDRELGEDVRRLINNVHFRHEDADMYCDSAFLIASTNSIRAYGNVYIQINDSVSIYGDVLYYNGNSRLAEMTGAVRLIDPQMTLTTRQLFYDLDANTGHYVVGGKIVDLDNELTSMEGYYFADDKDAFFRTDVVLTNPEYVMHADTLRYNTLTEIAHFFGPTTITSDANTIFCRNGWYDTRNDIARFSKDALFSNNEQSLTGDTLFYDRGRGYGRADMNIVMRDSVQNTVITGHFAEHFENEGLSIVTWDALMIHISDGDSLFMHADTLRSIVDDENEHRWLFAYNKARFFRHNLQGLSDSIVYAFSDSIIYMYHNPVLWMDVHQLTAERIEVVLGDEEVKLVHLFDAAFIVSEEEGIGFNQVKGRNMTAFFSDNDLYRINVYGNGETIYYVREEDGSLIGLNQAVASDIVIFVEEQKVSGIRFLSSPDAKLIPPEDLTEELRLLNNFRWQVDRRPKSKEDVFIWK